jgi:hypothetical protein
MSLPAQAGAAQSLAPREPSASPTYYLRAQVIAAVSVAVGNSLTGGGAGTKSGYAMSANGISGNWATGNYSIDFVIITTSSHAETGTLAFKVVSPGNHVVYQYSWGAETIPKGVDWFSVVAKGNYTAPGVYFAEWYLGSNLDGWEPLNFSA